MHEKQADSKSETRKTTSMIFLLTNMVTTRLNCLRLKKKDIHIYMIATRRHTLYDLYGIELQNISIDPGKNLKNLV